MKKSYFTLHTTIKKENEKTKTDFYNYLHSQNEYNTEKTVRDIQRKESIVKEIENEIFNEPTVETQEEIKKYIQDTEDPFLVKKVSKNLFFQESVLKDLSFNENAKIPK